MGWGIEQPVREQKPLPLGEVSAKQTERASLSPKSRHTAISRLSVRAMLSLCLRVLASILALSVTFGDSSPKGGAIGRPGHFPLTAESSISHKI